MAELPIWQYDTLFLILVLLFGITALAMQNLMAAAIVFGAYSFLMCLIWTTMGAVDVAFTEAAVGAGVSTVFIFATICFLSVGTNQTTLCFKSEVPLHYENLEKMGVEWTDPWEKPLHKIYETIPCLSPVPSLAIHCANINSIFGISPLVDVKKLWEDNED